MTEQELKKALRENRPEPPQGFERRSDDQLARLTQKEELPVKKFSRITIAVAVILMITVSSALAAGIISWRRGLEDKLRVTDETKDAYKDTQLFDNPGLSVAQNGVTVTLTQCIVEPSAAYIAFQVTGYQPQWTESGQYQERPQFRDVQIDLEGMEHVSFIEPLFFNGLDGWGRLADGSAPEDDEHLPYVNENGDMVYIISMRSDEDGYSFVGKKLRVSLEGLGMDSTRYQHETVQVDVEGQWTFEWTLKGCDKRMTLTGLDLPIAETGAVLMDAELSPIYIKMTLQVPRTYPHEEEGMTGPAFLGLRMKDGTVYEQLAGRGYADYADDTSDIYIQRWALHRIIDPDQVESLLFTAAWDDAPLEEAEIIAVKIQ